MKTKKYKNIEKAFFTAVFLSSIFLCLSCSNLFSAKTAGNNSDTGNTGSANLFQNAKYTVSGSIALKGALPAELAAKNENSTLAGNEKSAAPSGLNSLTITYTLTFTDSSDSTNNKTVTLTQGDETFSVELEKGIYTVSVTGCDDSGNKVVAGKSLAPFTLSDSNKKVTDLNIVASPISTGSGNGTVSLRLNITGCGIKAYKAVWTENGTEKCTTVYAGGAALSNPVFCMIEDGGVYPDDAPQAVGFYEIHFTFYNDYVTLDGSTEVFSCTEYINVFENLQTDTWVNDANTSYISGGSFTLTQAIIENRHKFYVDQANGNSTNEGSYFKPLDSVKTAVSKICAYNDGDPYKIILLSDVEEDSSEASYIYDAANGEFGSYIEIVPASTLNLTIEGYGTEKRTVNANRSSSNTGNVLYISENANVTLDNLIITGAYSVDLYGGGIRNVGELHIKNCDITGNTAAYGGGIALYDGSPRLYFENTQQIKIQGNEASAGGGGLYLDSGTVSFNNTAEILISENHASSGQGGGIFSNISIDIPDSSMVTVSKNESFNGSGIYFDSTSGTLNLSSDVNIENNTAINSGGGIYLMAGTLNIDGATLSENSAKAGGGISTRSSLTINKALITKNEATGEGGAIYSETTINSITLGEDVFFTKNQANTGSVIYSAGIITNLNLKCTFDDDGDNSFYDAEKNTSVADTHLLKLTGTSGTTKLNFYSTFNMNVDNSVYIATDEDDSGIATQIHIAESLANFDSKKIKIDPSCYPPEALGIQVFFVKSGLTAAEEYEKFSIVNDSSGNKYGINDSGKIIPVYTDWDTLVAAVTNITTGTATVTDFEIGSNMTMTRVLLSECPVRLYARKNYTLTLAEDCKSGVIKPSAELTIEGVDSAKITFDGNSVTSTASFISLDAKC